MGNNEGMIRRPLGVDPVVVEQEINRTEVILNTIQTRRTRSLNRGSEAVPVPIEVATVAMPEVVAVVNEEEIEIIQRRHTMQMLMFHHRQIQLRILRMPHTRIDEAEAAAAVRRDHRRAPKSNGTSAIGTVKH